LLLLGLRSALEPDGVHLHDVSVVDGTVAGGRFAAHDLLTRAHPPTAIVCADDKLAIGAIHAAHELGLTVPDDVSVVGHGDLDVASFVDPPLTTLTSPTAYMGELALGLVLDAAADADGSHATAPPVAHLLPGELVRRASTAPPARD
ncbi:MAG TPA: substrate-binding domain-containing protein, partial [Conexibacter sp.]|nr:substrate-binding domain-containing protein [Conexibacter sp.]